MKIVVCGSRDYNDTLSLFAFLDKFHTKYTIDLLIQGGAKGADRLALNWAIERKIKWSEYSADWKTYGKSAGFRRNQQMINQKPDGVIVFYKNPDNPSSGTKDCMSRAMAAAIPVYYGHRPL